MISVHRNTKETERPSVKQAAAKDPKGSPEDPENCLKLETVNAAQIYVFGNLEKQNWNAIISRSER